MQIGGDHRFHVEVSVGHCLGALGGLHIHMVCLMRCPVSSLSRSNSAYIFIL
jgi:hypothetical protein